MLITKLDEHYVVKWDSKTLGHVIEMPTVYKGLCKIYAFHSGFYHTCHPSIDKTGSVSGMIKRSYWKKEHLINRQKGYIYNMDLICRDISCPVDELCFYIEKGRVSLEELRNLEQGETLDLSNRRKSYKELLKFYEQNSSSL